MDEHVIKLKIQNAYSEPRAPERLIQGVALRAQAITMGTAAEKLLETAPMESGANLAARALIGRLAAVSELPKDAQPEQLAQQLEQEPAFRAALRGGNVLRRLQSGELMQQMTGRAPVEKQEAPQITKPPVEGPVPGGA